MAARSCQGVLRQPGKAARAAATASRTSSAVALATLATTTRVSAGLVLSAVSRVTRVRPPM